LPSIVLGVPEEHALSPEIASSPSAAHTIVAGTDRMRLTDES